VRARRQRGPCLGGDQEEEEEGEVDVERRRGGRLAREEDWAMAIGFARQRLSVAARLLCYARTKWLHTFFYLNNPLSVLVSDLSISQKYSL
jgi:hypothetical protein